mgnify:FL=1
MKDLWDRLWYSLYSTLIASAIRLRWHRLWIREDELHSSLGADIDVIGHLDRPTRLTCRLLGVSSYDEYSRDLHFRGTVKSNGRLYYSYSDLRIRSLIAAWRALKIHIHDLRFDTLFREINDLRHEYRREFGKLLGKAVQKRQEALLSGDRWAWFWTDMRAFRDYFFLITAIPIIVIVFLSFSSKSTHLLSIFFFDVRNLGILCLAASVVPFFTVFVFRHNHRAPYRDGRTFRYFCPWL